MANVLYVGGLKPPIAIGFTQIIDKLKVSAKWCQAANEQNLLVFWAPWLYTYTLYVYVSMCKYIYICRVDVSISPCVPLQLFAAVLGPTDPASQTSCE